MSRKLPDTDEYYAATQKLSEYAATLAIDGAQREKLIALMKSQVRSVATAAFKFGFNAGAMITENFKKR